jgi:hypothetical protein
MLLIVLAGFYISRELKNFKANVLKKEKQFTTCADKKQTF